MQATFFKLTNMYKLDYFPEMRRTNFFGGLEIQSDHLIQSKREKFSKSQQEKKNFLTWPHWKAESLGNMKVTILQIVVEALGTILKNLKGDSGNCKSEEELSVMITTLLKPTEVLWRILERWEAL